MKRGYTVKDYMEMFERIERVLPEATVSSDFIVGFSGETEEDFQKSIQLLERCRFKNALFSSTVSAGTKAADTLPDDIPREVKVRRNNELLEVQNRIAKEDNLKLVGEVVDVLVEDKQEK